ncbi:GNAT family N-acetyltransferase [Mesobacillus zeae]|uniref:GNAT family N-acetyltransferase n=1 Tax=Mesobacillus zeae TaxID=1917180 RepID=UPI0026ADE73A
MFIPIEQIDQQLIKDFFETNWGSTTMVTSFGSTDCSRLDGFVFLFDGEIKGIVTFKISGETCEIVSLDSRKEKKGIGTRLLQAAEKEAARQGCMKTSLITTNDNIHTLSFYQKRGYQCVKVIPDAVKEARAIKPEIPLVNPDNRIPIRDEFLFEKRMEL